MLMKHQRVKVKGMKKLYRAIALAPIILIVGILPVSARIGETLEEF
jgi:hypothetical protein